jgi:hypothetical protein
MRADCTLTAMVFGSVTTHHLPMEHRWGNRHKVIQTVRVATQGGVVARGRITNVSMSGAFVEAALPVSLLSYVKVQFNSVLDGRPTMIEGQVVRKDPTGFGLEWRELAPEVVDALVSRLPTPSGAKAPRLVFQRPTSPVAFSLSVE